MWAGDCAGLPWRRPCAAAAADDGVAVLVICHGRSDHVAFGCLGLQPSQAPACPSMRLHEQSQPLTEKLLGSTTVGRGRRSSWLWSRDHAMPNCGFEPAMSRMARMTRLPRTLASRAGLHAGGSLSGHVSQSMHLREAQSLFGSHTRIVCLGIIVCSRQLYINLPKMLLASLLQFDHLHLCLVYLMMVQVLRDDERALAQER